MLSFGIPSSFSVYSLRFFFTGVGADFVFCCFGGGPLTGFDTQDLELFLPVPLTPLFPFLLLVLLVELDFVRTVLVGAIFRVRNLAQQVNFFCGENFLGRLAAQELDRSCDMTTPLLAHIVGNTPSDRRGSTLIYLSTLWHAGGVGPRLLRFSPSSRSSPSPSTALQSPYYSLRYVPHYYIQGSMR